MKKGFLSVGIVCLVIFLAVSFSAATCTIDPGPVILYYTQYVANNSAVPIYLEVDSDTIFGGIVRTSSIIYSGFSGSIAAEDGYYLRIRNANTGQYLPFNPPNTTNATYYWVSKSNNFNISGGGWVSPER